MESFLSRTRTVQWTRSLIETLLTAPTRGTGCITLYSPEWKDGLPGDLLPERFELRKARVFVEELISWGAPFRGEPTFRGIPKRGDLLPIMGILSLVDSVESIDGQLFVLTWVGVTP